MLFVHNYHWKVNGRNFSWKETHFHRRGKPIFFYFSTGGAESFREPMLRWGHWDTKPHAQKFSAFPIETLAVEPESYFPIYWGPLVHSIQQKEKGRGCSSPVLSWLMFKSTLKLGKSVGFLCYFMFSLSFFSFFFPWEFNFLTLGFNEEGAPWLASNKTGQRDWSNSCANKLGRLKSMRRKGRNSLRWGMPRGGTFPSLHEKSHWGICCWGRRHLAKETLGQRHPPWVPKTS